MEHKVTKKRILFLYDFPLWGNGSAHFMRHLITELLALGHEVAVVAPDKRRLHKRVRTFTVPWEQIPVFVAHPELPKAKLYSKLSAVEIAHLHAVFLETAMRARAEFKPDVVHVNHLFLPTWSARCFKALFKGRYMITVHGSDLHAIELDRRYHLLTSDAVRGASLITAVSGDTRAWFNKLFGGEFNHKLRTQPGGVDIDLFPRTLSTSMIDRKYKLKGKNVVMFAGRLTKQKGAEYVVKAARKIKGEVFIIGDGSETEKLKKLARDLKLKNIHFLGYFGRKHSRELLEFYYRSDVFVAPSVWQEPLGLVILEAMACETPVVVTRKGGIPLAVKDKVNGLFVRSRNSEDIAAKVNYLLDNPTMREKMGRSARATVINKFEWSIIARRFERMYYEMVPGNNHDTSKHLLKK